MQLRNLSLGTRLNLALLLFMLVLGGAMAALIYFGFQRTQDDATTRSQEALEEEGKLALTAFAGGIADSGALQLEYAAEVGQRAGRYLSDFKATGATAPYDVSRLVQTEDDVWYDPDPERVSDLVIPNHVPAIEGAILDDVAYSAPLDAILPALAEGFPGQLSGDAFKPFAIVFVGVNGVGRYYPPIGIGETIPAELDISDFYDRFGPVANPERKSIWTPPYEDLQGRGLVITAQTPIYDGDVFRGIFEVDISIAKLVEQVNALKPTPNGFTFYVDSDGGIMRTDAYGLLSREANDNAALNAVLDDMTSGSGGTPVVSSVHLNGEAYFIAHMPMAPIGGSIAVAAPIDEVTAQAAGITASIGDQGERTLRISLAVMAGLLLAALIGATLLNGRVLIAPIQRLVTATEAVASGDLDTKVALDRNDELGALGGSFNTMVEQLRESERTLEKRVDDRTRELAALLEVSRSVSSTLDIKRLVGVILDELKTVMGYAGASVVTFEEDGLIIVDSRGPRGREEDIMGVRLHLDMQSGWIARLGQGHAVIIDDVRSDSEDARTFRELLGRYLSGEGYEYMRAWMAVPLAREGRTTGMLTMSNERPGFFAAEHATLVRAFADQAAIAIDNARLYEETHRRARETEALLRADAELFRSLDLDEVLQSLVDVAVDVLGAQKSLVSIWDLARGEAQVRASRNLSDDSLVRLQRFLTQSGHTGPAHDFAPIVYQGASLAEMPAEMRAISDAEGITATMDIPIRSPAGNVLGGFGIAYSEEHIFSDEEQRVLVALAESASVAIENAELYARAQQAASLEERQRLARELHDSVSQALYGIALGARTAKELLQREPAGAAEPMDYVLSLAEAGLAEMRALIFELRPESLQNEGVVAALEKQVAATQARFGIEVEASLGDEPDLPVDVKETLYRVGQEALHNVVKHANARHASVTLRQDNGVIELEIKDDGIGFDPDADYAGHLGLRSMRERAAKAGGTLEVTSKPETTSVRLVIPVGNGQ